MGAPSVRTRKLGGDDSYREKRQEVGVPMTHEPESNRSEASIARAGKHKWGYDTRQVDTFLARAHKLYESDVTKLTQRDIGNVSFDLRKNGYIISQVDAALSRLALAVSDRYTSWQITQYGRQKWLEKATASQQALSIHGLRAQGERFAPGRSRDPSYDRKQVDRLVDQLIAKTAGQLGIEHDPVSDNKNLEDITAARVSNVIFTQRRGKRGYDERQVDYFLVRAVELLQQMESYLRLSAGDQLDVESVPNRSHRGSSKMQDHAVKSEPAISDDSAENDATRYSDHSSTERMNLPLFPPDRGSGVKADSMPAVAVVENDQEDAQFNQLHQVERAIFDGAASAQAPVLVPPPVSTQNSASVNGEASRTTQLPRKGVQRSTNQVNRAHLSNAQQTQHAYADVSGEVGARSRNNSVSLGNLANTTAGTAPATPPLQKSTTTHPARRTEEVVSAGETTSQFNPLTDWADGAASQTKVSSTPVTYSDRPYGASQSANPPAVPAPEIDNMDFGVQIPSVDINIPGVAFSGYDDSEISDSTRSQ